MEQAYTIIAVSYTHLDVYKRQTPQLANAIGVELAEKEFPDYEVLVATHVDTGHLLSLIHI